MLFSSILILSVLPFLVRSAPSIPLIRAGPVVVVRQNEVFLEIYESYPTQYDDHSLVMAYYPDWAGDSLYPENINFVHYDWIDFAFAFLDNSFALTWDDPILGPSLLRRLVAAAHASTTTTKVKLSIGGWGGSKYFSSAVATAQSRQTFARNILAVYNDFGLDGIDIDWEYPAQAGLSGNESSPDDTANFLAFLQLLRSLLPPTARITAAVQTVPFAGPDGRPLQDVSAFAAVLDWILFMNYDTWGLSRAPGPNAPFYNRCHNSTQPGANAVAAFNAWSAAGFPASKMVLGMPSYGYLYPSNATRLRTRQDPQSPATTTTTTATLTTSQDLYPATSSSASPNLAQNITLPDPDNSGQIQFRQLLLQGALLRNNLSTSNGGIPSFSAFGGFVRYWDDCSSTPYLRSESAGQLVTYDDPQSLAFKALFAKQMGMRGVNMFDVHGDTDEGDLIQAVRSAMDLL